MGSLEFISALTGHLISWPVLVLVVVLILRKPIVELVGRVSAYEGLGQKIAFGEQLAKVEEEADRLTDTQGLSADGEGDGVSQRGLIEDLAAFADRHPSAVIMGSWVSVERAVLQRAADRDFPGTVLTQGGIARVINTLGNDGAISPTTVEVLHDLRGLRNQVAHGQSDASPGEALAYADIAEGVLKTLKDRT